MAGPPAWTIQRNDATVFLFGVRPGARDSGWITDRVESMMAESDEFWRETPPEEEITASPLLAEHGLSPEVRLAERLDEQTARRLAAVAETLGLDQTTLESFRPWVVAQLLQQGTLQHAGIPPDQNMDIVLTQLAERYGVAVRYEFDVAGIIQLFGELSCPLELDYLRVILDAAEGGPPLVHEGFAAWLRGDRSLDELADAALCRRYPEWYGPFIRDRNEAWLPRIDEMLHRPGTRFVAVGCGHLAGPDSILSFVRQLDCRVTP